MKIFNKKARYEYRLEKTGIEAGIALLGAEAKAIKTGHLDLSGSSVRLMNGELWLINANIPAKGRTGYNPTRLRKLLLHRGEILSLATLSKQRGLTLVPISVYTMGKLIKLELGLGKAKAKFEKKEAIKRRDIERELAEEFKGKI